MNTSPRGLSGVRGMHRGGVESVESTGVEIALLVIEGDWEPQVGLEKWDQLTS